MKKSLLLNYISKSASCVIIACLLPLTSFSQWTQVSDGMFGGRPSVFQSVGETLFVGTFNGYVYRSVDNGNSWEEANHGLLVSGSISALVADNDKIYLGNYAGGIYVSSDKGDSWVVMANGLFNQQITSLIVVNNDVFAGTLRGGLFVLRQDSDTWTKFGVGLPEDQSISSLAVSGDFMLAGFMYGKIYRSADGGNTWEESNAGVSTSTTVNAFSVLGDKIYASGSTGLYVSADHGSMWSKLNLLTANYFSGVVSYNSAIIVGTLKGPYISTNDGTSWAAANTGYGERGSEVLFVNDGRLFTGGFYTGIYVSDDGASTWHDSSNGFTSVSARSFVGDRTNLFAGTDHGIFLSQDQGGSWNAVNSGLPANKFTTDLLMDGTTLYAAFPQNGIYISNDNGNSWSAFSVGISLIDVIDLLKAREHLFAATASGLFEYSHESASWVTSGQGLPNGFMINSLGVSGDRLLANVSQNGVYYSDDLGVTWKNDVPEETLFDTRQFLIHGDTIMAPTVDGVHFSIDAGEKWEVLPAGINRPLESGVSIENYLFMAGYSGVHVSIDRGRSWSLTIDGFSNNIHGNRFIVLEGNLLVGTSQGVWSRPLADFYPAIESLSNHSGSPGDILTITGKNFIASGENIVTINGVEAAVVSATSTELTVTVPEAAGSGPVTVEVNNKVASSYANFCVRPQAPTIALDNTADPATLRSSAQSGNQWYLEGEPILGAIDSELEVTESGKYSATVTESCESKMSNTINFVVTGNDEALYSEFAIYPNPAAKHVNISLRPAEAFQEIAVDVYSALGRPVASYTAQAGFVLSVDVSDFATGLYFIKVRGNRDLWTTKFFKL